MKYKNKFKNYNKITIVFLIFSLISFIYFFEFYGCDKVDILSPSDLDVTSEAGCTKSSVEVQRICQFSQGLINMLASQGSISIGNCPQVTVNTSQQWINVNYGINPCISGLDSIRRSGSYNISYFIGGSNDTMAGVITYNNFKIYKVPGNSSDLNYVSVSGSDTIGFKKGISTQFQTKFIINNTLYTNSGSSISIFLNLDIVANLYDPLILTDDDFYIAGSGTIMKTGNYYYSIDNNNPVYITTNCRYPLTGKVYLDLSGNRFITDFSPYGGVCDSYISITKFGKTAYVDIQNAGF
jgi:hypothetical protein